jgi:hypothetical protein
MVDKRKHVASDYESEGRRLESCRARYEIPANAVFLTLEINLMIGLCHPFDHLSFSKRLHLMPPKRPGGYRVYLE